MRRSCSKRRLKVAAHRRRRLRCVAFCAHVRYRDPSTVEANRADCNGRSPHMRTLVPPAINLPLCAVRGQILGVPDSRALFARAVGAWGTGDAAATALGIYPGRPGGQFLSENEYGRFCRYGDHNADGRRSKARPNEGGSRREREDPDGILFSTPAVAGRGRGSVQDALRACLRACLRATDARNRTANARAASCSAWGPCFACMGQQVIMVDGRWSL